MSLCHAEYQVGASGRYSLISPIGISVLQSFGLIVLRLCAQAFHLRTCRTIVITIALQEVDNAPDAKTCAQCNHKGLQYVYCRIEKCHRLTSLSAALRLLNFCVCVFVHEKSRLHQKGGCAGNARKGIGSAEVGARTM